MKSIFFTLVCCFIFSQSLNGQDTLWTKENKQALIEQFKRTSAQVNLETAHLTSAQWNFKPTPTSWSISDVLEHLSMWEVITLWDVSYAVYLGPKPELAITCASDSTSTAFIYEAKPHTSPSFTVPTGLISPENNLKIFNTRSDEIIQSIETSDLNFKIYIRLGNNGVNRNLAQLYIIQYGHVDRHLRQILKNKAHPNFPAPQQDREAEIRRLETLERESVLKSDSSVLFDKIWSRNMVVNSPANKAGTVERSKMQLRTGNLKYSSFERTIEQITFDDNIAFVMGEEKIKPQGSQENAGRIVTRRFTNIWKFTNNNWSIIGRQATIIKVETN